MSRSVLLAVMAAWAMVGTGALRAGANVWTSLGPASGVVTAIAIDPQNSGTVYAATGTGLFKSGDSGASWSVLNPGPPCCISTLVIDPQTPSTIYGLSSDRKILKSTDGGTNWSPVNSGLPADAGGRYGITSLAIDPQNPTTLYAGNALPGGGVFKTTDGGESWNAVNSGPPDGGVIALAINPQDPGTIYASTWWNRVLPNNSGMLKSTDGGASWSAVNSGLENDLFYAGAYFSALAIDAQNPDTIYAAGYDTALYKTTNGGARWTMVGYGLTAENKNALAVDPRDPGTVYAGTSAGAFKSTDGGISWSAVKSRLITDANGPSVISVMAIDPQNPDTVYAIETYTGVFKTTDAGASWTTVYSEPTTPTGLTVLRIDPQNPGTMYAGTPVGIFKTTDAGANWTAVNAGLPSDTNGHLTICTLAIDPQTPSTIYALYVVTSADVGFWVGGGVFKSADGGVNWTRLNTPGGSDWLTDLTSGLAIDPQNPSIVYVGNMYGVIKTTDGGASWRWVNSGFPVSPNFILPNQNVAVTTLAIDPRNPGTVYAGSFLYSAPGSAVFKTTNGGASWKAVSSGLTGFYYAEILAIDSQNPSTIYARAVVYGSGGLLFKTTTGGASWTAVNSGLPNNVTALAIDPQNSSTVYAGTGSGVFRSTDGGTNWVAVNSGLTTLSVTTLAIDSQSPGTVYAGTSDGKVFGMAFAPEP